MISFHGFEHLLVRFCLKINNSYMPWAGKNFKEWQTKGLDKCQTVTCTIEDFENGLFFPESNNLKFVIQFGMIQRNTTN